MPQRVGCLDRHEDRHILAAPASRQLAQPPTAELAFPPIEPFTIPPIRNGPVFAARAHRTDVLRRPVSGAFGVSWAMIQSELAGLGKRSGPRKSNDGSGDLVGRAVDALARSADTSTPVVTANCKVIEASDHGRW